MCAWACKGGKRCKNVPVGMKNISKCCWAGKTFSVTYYIFIQERDVSSGKEMLTARTDKGNKIKRWGNETEVRKSVYHKVRHLNYNLRRGIPVVILC